MSRLKLSHTLSASVLSIAILTSPVQSGNLGADYCQKVINDYTGIFIRPSDQTGTRIGILRRGNIVHVQEHKTESAWIKIIYPKKGYVESQYLQPTSCPESSKSKN
jgi:hypothetical protein